MINKCVYVLAIVIISFVASCSIITIERFVHEDSAAILNTFYWTADNRTLGDVISADQKTPILVPDFNVSGSNRLLLRVITTENIQIYVDKFIIDSVETGEREGRTIRRISSPKQTSQGFWVATITIADFDHSESFVDADKLKLSVFWEMGKDESLTETTFELIRTRKKDIAWVT